MSAKGSKKREQCFYCTRVLTERGTKSPSAHTWDHKIPKSRGGRDVSSNRVPACQQCNHEKGNLTEAEYRHWRAIGRPDLYAYKWSLPEYRAHYERAGARRPLALRPAPKTGEANA
jgi:5-methylcytosine-specific restriction endonuclease McrA